MEEMFSSITAELWAVLVGLDMAWDKGFRTVILEVNSIVIIQKVTATQDVTNPNT